GMPDWGGFFCQARRFDAGILTDFKSNQRSPGGKDAPRRRFDSFQTRPKGFSMRRRTAERVFADGPVPGQLRASSILLSLDPLRGYAPCAPSFEWKFFDNL
ncbi:hypothetical protein, partial [Oscillibacter sp.]|uniref:hypothetical protein n=1 Tax=Oscillibacter sp. TaxID=1945593 RepID=UPI002600499D